MRGRDVGEDVCRATRSEVAKIKKYWSCFNHEIVEDSHGWGVLRSSLYQLAILL